MKRRPPKAVAKAPEDPVELGAVAAVHGLKGLLRVKPFTETPDGLAAYGPVWVALRGGASDPAAGLPGWREIAVTGVSKGVALCALEGVADRTTAEALKGATLSVDRSALPEAADDEFYQTDLVGLAVKDTDGVGIGTVRAVQDFGAGDMLDIQPAAGPSILVPFVEAFVPEVDVAGGVLVVEAEFIASMLAPVEKDPGDQDSGDQDFGEKDRD